MILYALLAGGDYDLAGLRGCGKQTAYRIAQRGSGRDTPYHPLSARDWRQSLGAIFSDRNLTARERTVLSTMPDAFPDPVILDLYQQPITSYPTTEKPLILQNRILRDQASIGPLRNACINELRWNAGEVLKAFRNHVWEGEVMSILCSVSGA